VEGRKEGKEKGKSQMLIRCGENGNFHCWWQHKNGVATMENGMVVLKKLDIRIIV
jgi:hypothetical protein